MCGRYTVIDDDDIAELRQIIPCFRGHITADELREPRLALPGAAAPVLTQHGDFMPVFLPFLTASNVDPRARACFIGLNASHTRQHMLRAV